MADEDINYEVELLSLDDDNCIDLDVRINGKIFHICFGPGDLREPGQSHADSAFEREWLDLMAAVNDAIDEEDSATATSPSEPLTEQSLHRHGYDSPGSEELELAHEQLGFADEELGSAQEEDIERIHDEPVESFALRPFFKHGTFQKLAPPVPIPATSENRESTLRDKIHLPVFAFTIKAMNADLVPIQIDNTTVNGKPRWRPSQASFLDSIHWDHGCPTVLPEEVILRDQVQHHDNATNFVLYKGQPCYFKAVQTGIHDVAYVREIDTLIQLDKLGLNVTHDPNIRIPKLEAVVLADTDYLIYGLLLTAIHPGHSVFDLAPNASLATRKRWCRDIERLISLLHAHDIIWGDFKSENMLVDKDENVWMIDFGGGRTEGWVDFENLHKKEGDLQGLARLKDHLQIT